MARACRAARANCSRRSAAARWDRGRSSGVRAGQSGYRPLGSRSWQRHSPNRHRPRWRRRRVRRYRTGACLRPRPRAPTASRVRMEPRATHSCRAALERSDRCAARTRLGASLGLLLHRSALARRCQRFRRSKASHQPRPRCARPARSPPPRAACPYQRLTRRLARRSRRSRHLGHREVKSTPRYRLPCPRSSIEHCWRMRRRLRASNSSRRSRSNHTFRRRRAAHRRRRYPPRARR